MNDTFCQECGSFTDDLDRRTHEIILSKRSLLFPVINLLSISKAFFKQTGLIPCWKVG